jgi:tetratricopeptide (TPR) repeat protein
MAADLPGSEAETVALTLELVTSRYFLGELEGCRRLLVEQEERVKRAGDPQLAVRHRFWLAHILSHLTDAEGADRAAREAIVEARRLGDSAAAGRAEYVLARESTWLGRYAAGIEHGRRAVSHLEDAGENWWLGFAHCWLAANQAFTDDFPSAFAGAERARALGERLGDARLVSYASGQAGWFEAMRGDGESAIRRAQEALDRATDPLGRALATAVLGLGRREAGDHVRAIEALDRAIVDMASFGYRRLVCWYTAWRADARLALGDLSRASADAREAMKLGQALGSPWAVACCVRTLGWAALARSDPAGEEQLREALQTFEEIGAQVDARRTRTGLATVTTRGTGTGRRSE